MFLVVLFKVNWFFCYRKNYSHLCANETEEQEDKAGCPVPHSDKYDLNLMKVEKTSIKTDLHEINNIKETISDKNSTTDLDKTTVKLCTDSKDSNGRTDSKSVPEENNVTNVATISTSHKPVFGNKFKPPSVNNSVPMFTAPRLKPLKTNSNNEEKQTGM